MLTENSLLFTIIAYLGGLCTVLSFIPQVIKSYKSKKTEDISADMYIIYNLGLVCWFTYGVYIQSEFLVIFNFLTFLFTFPILLMTMYYGKDGKGSIKEAICHKCEKFEPKKETKNSEVKEKVAEKKAEAPKKTTKSKTITTKAAATKTITKTAPVKKAKK